MRIRSLLCTGLMVVGLINSAPMTRPAGATEVVAITADNPIASVDCVSRTQCVAFDGFGRMVTSADAGATWTLYGARYRTPAKTKLVSREVDCASIKFCVVVELAASYTSFNSRYSFHWTGDHGATWKSMSAERRVQGSWCFQDNRCFVKIYGSFFLLKARGSSVTMSRSFISWSQTTRTISCPTANLCTAAGDLGHYATGGPTFSRSTDGGRTWRLVFQGGRTGAVSCVSLKRCIGTSVKSPFRYSKDGGRTFVTLPNTLGVSEVGLTVCPGPTRCLAEVVIAKRRSLAEFTFGPTGPPSVALVAVKPANIHPSAITYDMHCRSRDLCVVSAPERRNECFADKWGVQVMCAGVVLPGVSPLRLPAVSEDAGRTWVSVNPLREELLELPVGPPSGFDGTVGGLNSYLAYPVVRPAIVDKASERDLYAFPDNSVLTVGWKSTTKACPISPSFIDEVMRADGWEPTAEIKPINPYYADDQNPGITDAEMDAYYDSLPADSREIGLQSEWKRGPVHAIVTAAYSGSTDPTPSCGIKMAYSNGPLPRS